MKNKGIVLDANIIIRAVLGNKVIRLLQEHCNHIKFYTPGICFQDAIKYLPGLFEKRDRSPAMALATLESVKPLLHIVEEDIYCLFESPAKKRIGKRDMEDWPIVACSLALNCPVWTHDTDFFGVGISTWTTDTVDLYLNDE